MDKNVPIDSGVRTTILIENEINFDVYLDLELTKGNEYSLILKFGNRGIADIKKLNEFFNMPKALNVSSPYFDKNGYDITQIVVVSFKLNNDGVLVWNCVSDKPHNLEIK